jgi:hypothetical protein
VSTRLPGGAFPHQHGDPRGLRERIESQLRQRIEEAVEMAGIELLVALRRRQNRPAPEPASPGDREAFLALSAELLAHLREAFAAELDPAGREGLVRAEAEANDSRTRALRGQVFLALRLPDYWQRFDRYRLAYLQRRLAEPGPAAGNWLRRLFGG